MTSCRSCGAPIRWARTVGAGKSMPLDAEPSADGNVQLVGPHEAAVVLAGLDLYAAQQAGVPLYVSHFATCPHAANHRR